MSSTSPIAPRLLAWFDVHGRHDLPWQHPRTPYRVWLAEIMLQQTQVQTVLPYYRRFLDSFPDLPSLAAASEDQVLAHWAGLGYYSRGRNLHKAAQICLAQHGGDLPDDFEALLALPGIGRSTAGAILAQAHGQPIAILDGNVKRVLARHHGIHGWPGETAVHQRLWRIAEAETPTQRVADYTQAIMDLGATVCRRKPDCERCPLSDNCVALATGQTTTLPTARPRRERPTRRLSVLWLVDPDGRTLLEKRPPSGIWGGLWSLPEVDWIDPLQTALARQVLTTWCERQLGEVHGVESLPALQHDFTHFRLQLQPWRGQLGLQAEMAVAEASARRWIASAELASVGMPAPIAALIGRGKATAPQ